ncbi:MAG TPA: glycosyltransferase [Candidatus Cloacimonadota bacterium]|nr:glycosyltransferase [Candidatus Cloacimonadota bacterium]
MKTLFISSRIPYPPDRGDKVRTLYLLRQFAAMGEVCLISLVDPHADAEAMKVMKEEISDCHFVPHSRWRALWNLAKNIFSSLPFQVAYYLNPKLMKLVRNLDPGEFDVIYCHLIRMVPYARNLPHHKVVLDYTDCISLEYSRSLQHLSFLKRVFFRQEANRTAQYELQVANLFAENWVISPVDISMLGLQAHHRSIVLPNQVKIPELLPQKKFQDRLIFTGNMSVAHNVVAAQNLCFKIMPALLRSYPALELLIVGANPSPEVLALHKFNGTRVLGFVDDLYAELIAADIFVAPMYFSAGIQNKALEAMACGLPVVTTSNVAKSLDAHDEVELMIADDNLGFVKKVTHLIQNAEARDQIGRAGRSLILKKYSPAAVSDLIRERLNRITNPQ